MIQPGTFKPVQMRNEINTQDIKHYDLDDIYTALSDAIIRKNAQKYAAPFGFNASDAEKEKGAYIRQAVANTIDECLSSQRPDLDIDIWETIIQAVTNKHSDPGVAPYPNPFICPITIDMIRHAGFNLGAVILFMLMVRANKLSSTVPSFYNAEGTVMIDISMRSWCNATELCVSQYVIDQSISWNAPRLTIYDLPDTVMNHIDGKKLSEILSHPVFDRYDMNAKTDHTLTGEQYVSSFYRAKEADHIPILTLAQNEMARLLRTE